MPLLEQQGHREEHAYVPGIKLAAAYANSDDFRKHRGREKRGDTGRAQGGESEQKNNDRPLEVGDVEGNARISC